MAILNKNAYDYASRGNRIENSAGPVVTTDEVAVAIQVDGDGDATGFTSLTSYFQTLGERLSDMDKQSRCSMIVPGIAA